MISGCSVTDIAAILAQKDAEIAAAAARRAKISAARPWKGKFILYTPRTGRTARRLTDQEERGLRAVMVFGGASRADIMATCSVSADRARDIITHIKQKLADIGIDLLDTRRGKVADRCDRVSVKPSDFLRVKDFVNGD